MITIRTRIAAGVAAIAIGGFGGISALPSTAAPSAAPLSASVNTASDSARWVSFVNSLPPLDVGASGYHVLGLQQLLMRDPASKLQGTGYFGAQTKAEVQKVQRANGITASGHVGVQTWAALMRAGDPARCFTKVQLASPNLSPGQRLTTSTQFGALFAMSFTSNVFDWLQTIGSSDKWTSKTTYDRDWVSQVKAIQARTGIPATGIYGPRTAEAVSFLASISPRKCVS